jgi:type VI secretion system protein ImpA
MKQSVDILKIAANPSADAATLALAIGAPSSVSARAPRPTVCASSAAPQSDWLAPLGDAAPCGHDLEYDPEFVVLSAQLAAKTDVQYGDFIGQPAAINWSDVERDCCRLMTHSKDIRLAVVFARCRTRLAGVGGLAQGVGLLAAWLCAFPAEVHPQLVVDADRDAACAIRLNALQALTDTQGLLADVRDIVLTRASATRLKVRDVERAFAQPRLGDALTRHSVEQQLRELHMRQPAMMADLDRAEAALVVIETWSREHLGSLFVPDLGPLVHVLRLLTNAYDMRQQAITASPSLCDDAQSSMPAERTASDNRNTGNAYSEPPPRHNNGPTVAMTVATAAPCAASPSIEDRRTALQRIREVREWFELHEPSSPVPVLLRRAEQFFGKRYAEAIRAVPAELLATWSLEET